LDTEPIFNLSSGGSSSAVHSDQLICSSPETSDFDSSNDYYSIDSGSAKSSTDNSSDENEGINIVRSKNPIEDLKENLHQWSVNNNITSKALSQLLFLLWSWLCRFCICLEWLNFFPKDARTL